MRFDVARVDTPTQDIIKARAECHEGVLVVEDRRGIQLLRVEATRECVNADMFVYETDAGRITVLNMKTCGCGGTRVIQKEPA